METNLESLDEVISRNRRSMAVFCPYQEVIRQCYYCAYCLRLPSEDNRMVCTLAINDHNTYDFDGLE